MLNPEQVNLLIGIRNMLLRVGNDPHFKIEGDEALELVEAFEYIEANPRNRGNRFDTPAPSLAAAEAVVEDWKNKARAYLRGLEQEKQRVEQLRQKYFTEVLPKRLRDKKLRAAARTLLDIVEELKTERLNTYKINDLLALKQVLRTDLNQEDPVENLIKDILA